VTGSPTSLYVDTAGVGWQTRRPGMHWKILWEDGDRRVHTVTTPQGALVLAIMSGSTEPLPA